MQLVSIIFICLLIAFLLGLFIGYFIRGWRCERENQSGNKLIRPNFLYEEHPEAKDDLKRINGIGPVLEEMLNKLGIYKFEQLASLSKSDVAWVAHHIEAFPDRIYDDKWIEQAKQLAKEQEQQAS